MTAFAMSASAGMTSDGITGTLTTNPTAYGTYGVYGYNGEYTHTSLGLQYLRARYLNVATGTFTSRDTYAGKLQDILSQNRYTYAENNPVGHSDPSGHAPKKSGIGAMLQKTANTLTKMPMFTAPKARAATQAAVSAYAEEQKRKNTIVQNNAAQLKSNQGFLQNMDIAFYTLLPSINPGPGFVTPLEVRIQQCAAYNYCRNEIQELIRGKDAGRIAYGSRLILEGIGKATGAYGLTVASTTVSATGLGTAIGLGGFAASAWLATCSMADVLQGTMEVYYGFQGDSLTETTHLVKDSAVYDSNDLAYHLSTNVAAVLGNLAGGLAAARPAVGGKGGSDVWDMTEGGGIINGREYSQHAMERMAPDTPSVRAELSRRAEALAESKGLQVGTPEYYQFCQKYVDPRNIPPSVIEDAIRNTTAVPGHTAGTFVHQTADVTVIVNEAGKVITVIPK